ncbi:MAG TPA: DUF2231 domain-containing protein [Jiangellales bacterium]|nr:DUF2231 domain-containing protein [Jiangellales bacterium]
MPETVLGLPLHPLVVHAVVVLIPLTALGAVAVALVPRWLAPYSPLVALGALGGAVTAFVAKQAGDNLAESLELGGPVAEQVELHGRYGLWTSVSSIPFAVLAVATYVLQRQRGPDGVTRVVAVLAAVAGLVVTGAAVLAGHSGSTAVWNPGSL